MMRTRTLYISCKAPLELFTLPWDELTPAQQALFDESKIPCQESGSLWAWCDRCPFGEVEADEVEEYESQ